MNIQIGNEIKRYKRKKCFIFTLIYPSIERLNFIQKNDIIIVEIGSVFLEVVEC